MSVIDAFLDALWLEQGASDHTLAAYRRDLTAWQAHLESHGEARARANKMCGVLAGHASGGKMVYVSAHGWFNRMLKGSLMKRGWKCVSQNGDLHWSHRRFERPTDYKDK